MPKTQRAAATYTRPRIVLKRHGASQVSVVADATLTGDEKARVISDTPYLSQVSKVNINWNKSR